MSIRLAPSIMIAALAACQSMPTPAVLASGDAAALGHLRTALGKAMGRTRIDLGPGDPTQASSISVLPPALIPQDDRSLAVPTIFRLEIQNGACVLVREDNRTRYPADGVDCRAAK